MLARDTADFQGPEKNIFREQILCQISRRQRLRLMGGSFGPPTIQEKNLARRPKFKGASFDGAAQQEGYSPCLSRILRKFYLFYSWPLA
jgi:hypothetical protein